MKKILIVGYGNSLRGDDGLGPLIAQQIADRPEPASVRIRVVRLPQLDISLVSDMKDADTVIFVDARHDEDENPVVVKSVTPQASVAFGGHSTHCLGVDTLVTIIRDWYDTRQQCFLVMPKGYDFSIGDNISFQGMQAADSAINKIDNLIRLIPCSRPGCVLQTLT
jgi:hydrogenase maturation protease